MAGIDLNSFLAYKCASLRFFEKNEHHVSRFCNDNVLLMVYDGVLRFSEDGEETEVHAGKYYIQRKNRYHEGRIKSDAPKYLYVHFDGEWTEDSTALSYMGDFDYALLSDLIGEIDSSAHKNAPFCEMQYLFLKLILALKNNSEEKTTVHPFSEYVDKNLAKISSLSDICEEFHYSKNYVIRVFNKEFGKSPIQYINDAKIKRAMYLLQATSRPIREVMEECGYSDYSYFYKRFLGKTGLAPQKWREKIQKNPLLR